MEADIQPWDRGIDDRSFRCDSRISFRGGIYLVLQEVGINMGDNFAQTGMMINDVVRARLTAGAVIQGIVPGIFASVAGTLVASLAIFKRSEANLFRELEAG